MMEHHPLITSAMNLLNYLSLLGSKEMTVSVADTEKYLLNVPSPTRQLQQSKLPHELSKLVLCRKL